MRVPAYSPESIAEHAVGMILSLVRNVHHQYNRVRNGNFAMDNLVGFTLRGRVAGIVGTGISAGPQRASSRGSAARSLAPIPIRMTR